MSNRRGMAVYLFLMAAVIVLFMVVPNFLGQEPVVSRAEYLQALTGDQIDEAVINQNSEVPTGSITYQTKDGETGRVYVTDVRDAEAELQKYHVEYTVGNVARDSLISTIVLPLVLGAGVLLIVMLLMNRNAGNVNSRMLDFGKSRAQMAEAGETPIRFDDVAGLYEEKEELVEIVDFLRNPARYTKVGARIPKGVILVGPPGTGKTLLAKAVAGEAGVPFFSISGSDFVEMFVGVGASRVRDLFDEAKKNAPCIVFIDEIDAVGRRRGTGMGGGHDEREQTLNQLLVEMDGFGVNEGIIVMAATNRVDILDPAILRPGRFDRKVAVSVPDVRGREAILKVHCRKKPLAEDVDLLQIAQTTAGFTGADLENLMNESAIRAARMNRAFITQEDIRASFVKVGIGTEKKSRIISEKEKRITAYHETGHAILFHVLPDMEPVYSISIIPTGPGAAGYTMPQPENDDMFNTKGKMLQQIIVDLGGRVAEELVFDDITTGASQDIKQATTTARAMVMKYGMSNRLGLVNYDNDSGDVFIGRDWGHTKSFSENVAAQIDEEVKEIIETCHGKARELIGQHKYVLEECTRQLLEKEKLGRQEFEAIFAEEEKLLAAKA